jgi:hypothetical protein
MFNPQSKSMLACNCEICFAILDQDDKIKKIHNLDNILSIIRESLMYQ